MQSRDRHQQKIQKLILRICKEPTSAIMLQKKEIICAVAGVFTALIVMETPFLFICPPLPLLIPWANAIISSPNWKFLKRVKYMATFLFFLLVGIPFINIFWILDEIIFWNYRDVKLDNSVFVVAGFRTGSTNLHRALSLDNERFVSPRMIELLLPLLSVQYIIDGIEWIDSKYGTSMISYLEVMLCENYFGKELTSRHPMSWYGAEEDDILLALWERAGWYAGVFFPNKDAWMSSGKIDDLSANNQSRICEFYMRSMQKVLYRRGGGRILLSKSHLINLMPLIQKNIPNARFVGIVRNPKDTFVSWYSLAQASLERISSEKLPVDVAVEAHLEFWDEFTKTEMMFFKNANYHSQAKNTCSNKDSEKTHVREKNEQNNRMIMTFSEYLNNQKGAVEFCYASWGYGDLSSTMVQRLKSVEKEHAVYKKTRDYTNPTLEDLGLDSSIVTKRYDEYIKTYGL